jgi:hypothetical protein
MKKILIIMLVIVLSLISSACADKAVTQGSGIPEETQQAETGDADAAEEQKTDDEVESRMIEMTLKINDEEVNVKWEDNESVRALAELAEKGPVTIDTSLYGGFEQVGSIGQSIVRNDKQTKTSYGDIVLYSGDQIVIFYGSNSWSYTRLGHIDLTQQEMKDLLGGGDVSIMLQ